METEVLQSVLVEVLEELKEVKQQQAETVKILMDFKEKIPPPQLPLTTVKLEASSTQAEKIAAAINTQLDAIKQVIETQPRPVMRQMRILFFPEFGAREYFKTVGKISLWLLAFIICSYLFVLGKEFINKYSDSSQSELITSRYKASWINLYRISKKGVRQKMDSVWRRTR